MKKTRPTDALHQSIAIIDARSEEELRDLKKQFHLAYESLRPINILKSTFSDISYSPEVKRGLGKTAISIATGFLAKNLFFRSTWNPIKIVGGLIVQAIASKFAAKNSDKIISGGQKMLHAFSTRKLNSHNQRVFSESEIYD